MKVESPVEARSIQHLDQPTLTSALAPTPAKVDEIAQLFDQEVVSNSRALTQRSMTVRVPPTQQLAQLYDRLGHPAQASLASLSRRIRLQLLQHPSVDKLLELTGGDPARAFVVLKHVQAEAGIEGRPSEETLARDAVTKLEVRFKGEIQAGLNIAKALQAGGGDPQELQALRTLYYASVVSRQSLATIMQALLGVYGSERFAAGLLVMLKALSDDIAAHVSSIPTARLQTLLRGLQSCEQLTGCLALCQTLIQRLGINYDAVSLLQRILGYASTGIGGAEVQRLAEEFGEKSPGALVFLNAFYSVVKQLPLALWADSRVREEALHLTLLVMGELAHLERGTSGTAGALRNLA